MFRRNKNFHSLYKWQRTISGWAVELVLILCSSFCLWVGMCQKWNLINFIFTSLLLTALYTNKTYSFIIRFFKDFKAFLFITGFYCGSLKSPSAFETKCPHRICVPLHVRPCYVSVPFSVVSENPGPRPCHVKLVQRTCSVWRLRHWTPASHTHTQRWCSHREHVWHTPAARRFFLLIIYLDSLAGAVTSGLYCE